MGKGIHIGSTTHKLLKLGVDEAIWLETTAETYAAEMRKWNGPKRRRPEEMQNWVIRTKLFTAVSAASPFDVRYLIEVKRMK